MARARTKPRADTPPPAAAASDADFEAMLHGLLSAASTGTPSRWSKVFQHLNDSRNRRSIDRVLVLADPLLIPLA